MPMSLDGLRAWIGEVERKLGVRTRVFLVLLAIAIGASGTAIYLALEADDGGGTGGASTEEVQELREQFEVEGGASQVSSLESQIVELRSEVEGLRAKEKAQPAEGESGAEGGSGAGAESGAEPGTESGAEKVPETGVGEIPESEAK
jgi:TolA-binding protein